MKNIFKHIIVFIVSQSAVGKMQFEKIKKETKSITKRKVFTNKIDAEEWLNSMV